jgi:hypothetical protein
MQRLTARDTLTYLEAEEFREVYEWHVKTEYGCERMRAKQLVH